MKKSPWTHGLSDVERHAFDEYRAAWDLRRLADVDNSCSIQRWAHAFGPCEALASRDPGQVRA